jgi:multidrug transporter EmrE-like cation transporter
MTILSILSIALAAVMNAGGSFVLKYASTYKMTANPSTAIYYLIFAAALLLFGGSFPFYAFGLSRTKLSIAQPIFSVGTYLTVAVFAFFLLKESYSLIKTCGLAVIILGVIIVACS